MAANVPPAVPPVPVPPVPPPALTVLNGMIACGLSNVVQANVGSSPAQRAATQIFFDDFTMCLTLTDKEIDNNFKSFADLPIAEGRIKVMPGVIKMIKAFTYGPKLDHSLINPNQVRDYGIGFWDNPYNKSKGLNINLDETTIQLQTMGTKIYFETRAPTDHELATCPRIDMTSPHQWNPTSISLKSVSTNKAPKRRIAEIQTGDTIRFEYSEYDSDETLLHSVAPSFTDLKTQMQEIVARNAAHYEFQDLPTRQTYTSTKRHET